MNIQRTFVNRGKPLRDLEFLPGTFINRGITLRDIAIVSYGRRSESRSIARSFGASSHSAVVLFLRLFVWTLMPPVVWL